MRPYVLFCAAGLFHAVVNAAPEGRTAHLARVSRYEDKRDLTGLFGGWGPDGQGAGNQPDGTPGQFSSKATFTDTATSTDSNSFGLFSPWMTTTQTSKSKDTASSTSLISPSATTISESESASTAGKQLSASPSSTATLTSEGHSSVSASGSSSDGPATWKIVGIAVIAFSTVALMIMATVFFDHWWRFVRDLVGRKRAKDGVEELIPDWEKASWEVRFGDDRHRYPSFASVPSGILAPPPVQTPMKSQCSPMVQTQDQRISGGYRPSPALTDGRAVSPGSIGPPDNTLLSPYPRYRAEDVSPFIDYGGTPIPANTSGPFVPATSSLLCPDARIDSAVADPFVDRHKAPTPTDAYGGIEEK
ncbi:hypothetical protein AcW1_001071 [Taiwanofungus camphoratus]|nr:hypothetical protein AcW1_001071 [Antrodia cinnamomea]